jgi:hypothetical protein
MSKNKVFFGQRPLVPLLLFGPPFFPIILFGSTTLLTGMTGNPLLMRWPLTSQSVENQVEENQVVERHSVENKLYIKRHVVKNTFSRKDILEKLHLVEMIYCQTFIVKSIKTHL